MRIFALMALAMTLALGACSPPKADAEREAQADRTLSRTIAGEFDALLAEAAPPLEDTATTRSQLAQAREALPRTTPPEGRTVSWRHETGTAGERYFLQREYAFPNHVIATETVMTKGPDGRWRVVGFHFNGATAAEAKAMGFTLAGKSTLHLAVLAAAAAVPLFILVTTGFALYRRRWGWAILSLFGVMALQLNWTTGQWAFQPIHFNLLGAGFMKSGSAFAPWILTVSLPLAALLFWGLGKHRRRPAKAKPDANPSGESA